MDELEQGATADVGTQDQEISMEDTIRDTLASLTAQEDSDPVVNDAQNDEPKDSGRDASGRFAKKEVEQVQDVAASQPQEAEQPTEKTAPNTWKKEAQEAFKKADPILQAEIERREADFYKGIEQYKNAASFASSIDQAITPYKQTLQNLGVAPDVAIAELMKADNLLRFGAQEQKELYAAQLFQSYGIDLNNVLHRLQNTDPRMLQEQQRANYYENQAKNYQMQHQQQEMNQLNSEIQSFAADPAHSHFENVRGHMAALIQAGQAKDLKDAYEQAIYANPVTRAAVLQQREADMKAEMAKKAQMAKAASSVNVRSRPSMPTEKPIGTMDDTIRDKFRELTTRGN